MSFSEAPVLWIVWLILLALCGGAAIAGLVVGIRVARERKAGAGDDAEAPDPADGSAASAGTVYISGTFGGGRPVAWTGRKALDVAQRCGASYVGLIQGGSSSTTTVSSGWGHERVSGTDRLAQAAAKFHVPIPTQIEPFAAAYDRAILMLVDRPLYGHHVRVYLLRYAEPYEGTQYDAPRHRDLYALVVALDAGLPGTVESTLARVIADQGVGELRAFDGEGGAGGGRNDGGLSAGSSDDNSSASAGSSAGVRFLTVLQPDSGGVGAVYDAVAAL